MQSGDGGAVSSEPPAPDAAPPSLPPRGQPPQVSTPRAGFGRIFTGTSSQRGSRGEGATSSGLGWGHPASSPVVRSVAPPLAPTHDELEVAALEAAAQLAVRRAEEAATAASAEAAAARKAAQSRDKVGCAEGWELMSSILQAGDRVQMHHKCASPPCLCRAVHAVPVLT